MDTLIITITAVLPFITFCLGSMYGGSEARKELKAQKNPYEQGTLDHWRFKEREENK